MRTCKECKNYIFCKREAEENGEEFDPDYEGEEFCADRLFQPMSNADHIRAMSDRELASFMAERTVKESCLRLNDEGYEPTATQIAALREKLFQTWIVWLQQHVEDAYEETST